MRNCSEEIANVLLISGRQDKLSWRNFILAKTLETLNLHVLWPVLWITLKIQMWLNLISVQLLWNSKDSWLQRVVVWVFCVSGVLCAVLCSDHLLICSVMGKPWSQAWTQLGDYWNELNSRDRIPLKQKCIIWWNFHHWLHWLRCSQWWKFHQNCDVSVNEWKASQSCGHRWLANVDPM